MYHRCLGPSSCNKRSRGKVRCERRVGLKKDSLGKRSPVNQAVVALLDERPGRKIGKGKGEQRWGNNFYSLAPVLGSRATNADLWRMTCKATGGARAVAAAHGVPGRALERVGCRRQLGLTQK
jgi:hypothetical protein